MKFTTEFKQISGLPATPTQKVDTFTLTIRNRCFNDVLQKASATTDKTAYAGVTMTIPAISYTHSDGLTDTDCPVTITQFVSSDNGATWQSSGAVYTEMISAAVSGKLTLIPSIATFGTTGSTRLVKVVYTNGVTSASITD